MASDVPLVVVGSVAAIADVKAEPDPDPRGRGLIFTDYRIVVAEVLQGEALVGSTIVVHQTGGVASDGRSFEIDDDPLFEEDATYLLFLEADPNTDRYYVAGGPDGRLVVEGDTATSLSGVYPDRRIDDLRLVNEPLTTIRDEVRAAP